VIYEIKSVIKIRLNSRTTEGIRITLKEEAENKYRYGLKEISKQERSLQV
jgi:hypothetical protein